MSQSAGNRKASAMIIFFTLVIEAMGFGIIMPVLPDVIRKFVEGDSNVATTYGYFVALYAALQFLAAPVLGRLSDKYGRRPVLLFALIGTGIDYLFMAFAPTLPLLFLGRLVSGISGASYTVASAYIADVSDDSNRSKNFGLIGAGFGLGFILGPALGGIVAGKGLAWPFLISAGLNVVNFIFVYFFVPESLSKENRRSFSVRELNPFKSLSILASIPQITLLVGAFFLLQLASQTHPSIWAIYTEWRFEWSPQEVGYSLAVVGLLSTISQGLLTGPLTNWLGEKRLVIIGCLGECFGFFFYGLATSGTMVYVVLIISSIFWAAMPAMQSLISREIPPEKQGELQGALMSLVSVTAIINPLVMTRVFAASSEVGGRYYLPGAPYYLSAVIILLSFIATVIWSRRHEKSPNLLESR